MVASRIDLIYPAGLCGPGSCRAAWQIDRYISQTLGFVFLGVADERVADGRSFILVARLEF